MLSPVPTPYDDRIASLRDRLDKKKGKGGGSKIRGKLQNQKAKAYMYGQANYQAPTPYSGAYDASVAGLNRDYSQTQSSLAGQRLATEQQYGFGGDQSNPFSAARTLERNYQQQRQRSQNSYAAAGQLYSGALSNRMAGDRYNAEQALDTSQREYAAKLAELTGQGVEATNRRDQGMLEAEAQKLEDAINQPPDPDEAPKPPGFVNKFTKDTKQRIRKLEKQGKENKADKLRKRLRKLQGQG